MSKSILLTRTTVVAADLVRAERVSRRFPVAGGEVAALTDVDIAVQPAEFLALIGRSGSGKTTLLNLIAGLDVPTAGTITVDGEVVNEMSEDKRTILRRQKIGFVFQSFGLLPLLSAEENVELALRIAGASPRDRTRRAREVLDLVGLGGRRKHRPYELSGGEQQRVAIARAIANRPLLILADEPTGELDSTTALQVFQLLDRICRDEGTTIITTTHDQLVMEHVHRVVELADGRVVASGQDSALLAFGRRRRFDAGVATEQPERASLPVDYGRPEPAAPPVPRDERDGVLSPILEPEPAPDPEAAARWSRPNR